MGGGAPQPLTFDDGEAGLAEVERRLARDPENGKLREAKYLILLALGWLDEGWREFDGHLTQQTKVTYESFPVPRHRGEGLAGKHVLTWCEQGLGDQIFQAGMFPELLAACESATIFCARRLAPLFRRSFPDATVYRVGEQVPERVRDWTFDTQLSIADLGALFRRDLNFEARPYLRADPEKIAAFKARYRRFGDKVVGLSWWSKNSANGNDKSMLLAEMGALLQLPGAVFVNLQYGHNQAEIAEAERRFGIRIFNDTSFGSFTDIDGFAAQVAAMDMVLTTSNTTAHMAGALGVPGVVLLPARSQALFWYWHTERRDSPWYPSLRLARQKTAGAWDGAVEQALEFAERILWQDRRLTA